MTRVLVACEFSGVVRDAFTARGFDATSCDLLPSETPGRHYRGDVRDLLAREEFDLLIAHPPCTHLATSGNRWRAGKEQNVVDEALAFVCELLDAPVRHIALENPVSIITSRIRRPTQTIHPWQYGHGEQKATCLWLRNLPRLRPTKILPERGPAGEDWREQRVWKASTRARANERSRTYPGIAAAMAEQWGSAVSR